MADKVDSKVEKLGRVLPSANCNIIILADDVNIVCDDNKHH